MKNINPKDKNNRYHGYVEWYWHNGDIWLRSKFIHGREIGYEERHYMQDSVTNFYIR